MEYQELTTKRRNEMSLATNMLTSGSDMEDTSIKGKSAPPNTISVSVTWIEGRLIFKENVKWSKCWYGICALNQGIFAISPLDYELPTMITTIRASFVEKYCERAFSCLDKTCPLNQFNKDIFLKEFADMGSFSLGLPEAMGDKVLWFSEGKWKDYWKKFIIPISGGILKFDENRAEKESIIL
jgi:hypothetical protein